MKRPATKAKKGSSWIRVPHKDVVAIFEEHYPGGPLPTETQCYHLANAIDIVRNKKLPPVKNEIPHYPNRRRLFDAVFKLVEGCIETYNQYPGYRPPPLIYLEDLQGALKSAKNTLLGAPNTLAGERRGAEWHWPAYYLARFVEETLRAADRKKKYLNKKISRDKRGKFVLVVGDILELAGLEKPSPEAVAAVLQKSAI